MTRSAPLRQRDTFSSNTPQNPIERWLRILLIASLIVGVGGFIAISLHWKMMVDSPIIHYANFLISQGVAPYRELQENNLPGAYMTEWFGMHLFGGGDLAWRFFEFFELAVCTACMIYIARPYDWLAGLFAGGVFTILHAAEGPYVSGEREIAMTALVLCGYAALFGALRRGRPALMLVMGFNVAFAASIKPTLAPLALILLGMTVWQRRREHKPWTAYAAWAALGMVLAVALNFAYLASHHVIAAFFHLQSTITTYYAQLQSLTISQMVRRLFYQPIFDVLLFGGAALLFMRRTGDGAKQRSLWTGEQWMLFAGALMGIASYILQRKNFLHHRYLYQNLLLLLIGIEVLRALRGLRSLPSREAHATTGTGTAAWRPWLAAALILFVCCAVVPRSLAVAHRMVPESVLTTQLERDLQQLGGTAGLQRRVVCLDQTFGCLNALYHLQLVENTPLSGDMLLFARRDMPVIREARQWYATNQQQHPADLLVVTNENFLGPNNYNRLQAWPQYNAVIARDYILILDRRFDCNFGHSDGEEAHLYRYRIYARLASSLAKATLAPLPPCAAKL